MCERAASTMSATARRSSSRRPRRRCTRRCGCRGGSTSRTRWRRSRRAHALGIDAFLASVGIAQCPGVPGRLERIMSSPIGVVVDFAHTGEALAGVLELLRGLTDGRLIAVFGAAGERPSARRRGMGEAAARLADYSVLTEEDPRSEPPDAIIDEIARAMVAAGAEEGRRFERVPDRRAAITRAVALAEQSDVVLIAGKGHEPSIERADGPQPWDDRAVAREILRERFADDDEWA